MSDDNPYQPPGVAVHDIAQADPRARLYSVAGITLAAFVGSAFAGGLLMALNYRSLGEPVKARNALVLAFFATAAVLALAMVLPESVPGLAFVLPQLLVVQMLARKLQGVAIGAHQARGAAMHSNWLAFGISLLVAAALVAIAVVVVFLLPASLLA